MANTTELHPKVRQTCIYLDIKLIILYCYKHLHTSVKGDKCPIGSSEDVVENIYNTTYNLKCSHARSPIPVYVNARMPISYILYNVHRSWQ